MNRIHTLVALLTAISISCNESEDPAAPAPLSVATEIVISAPDVLRPIGIAAPTGDDRIWVAEQRGRILVLKPDSTVSVFLDITNRISGWDSWHGIGSFVFHPDYFAFISS